MAKEVETVEKDKGKKRVIIILVITLAGIIISLAVYLGFFYSEKCVTFSCFQENMQSCSRASYLNEEPESSWYYKIKGFDKKECVIEITLLQAKQGSLQLEKLNGLKMECGFIYGFPKYPEQDLSKCTGKLKEGLQEIMISKLHNYIIENIGEFEEELGGV